MIWGSPTVSVDVLGGRFVRTGTDVPTQMGTEHNIHTRESRGIPVRSVPAPTPPKWGSAPNVTSATECGDAGAWRVLGVHATVAVALHPLHLLLGQQRIRHESVVREDRVVPSVTHGAESSTSRRAA